ncbi:MAG: MFS transporter [Nitrososphaeria archaeon]|nr:MFS transporter [Nitrososphaeria archaeon]
MSYIFHAIAITEIGTALSQIKSEFMLSKTLGGVVASLQSLAGILAILGGILSDIFGKIRLISLSLAIMGVGLLLIYSSPFLLILGISFIIFGAGRGFFEASVNAFISEVFSEKRGMAINLLHIGWNIGSAIGPPLAAYMILTYGSWRLGYIMMSPPLMALSLIMLILVSRSSCKGKARVHTLEKTRFKTSFRGSTPNDGPIPNSRESAWYYNLASIDPFRSRSLHN